MVMSQDPIIVQNIHSKNRFGRGDVENFWQQESQHVVQHEKWHGIRSNPDGIPILRIVGGQCLVFIWRICRPTIDCNLFVICPGGEIKNTGIQN